MAPVRSDQERNGGSECNAVLPTCDSPSAFHGKRVWILGRLDFPEPNAVVNDLPPAPLSKFGWNNTAYCSVWSLQLGKFIRRHVHSMRNIPVAAPSPVSPQEYTSVVSLEGWVP